MSEAPEHAVDSPYLVSYDGELRVSKLDTRASKKLQLDKSAREAGLREHVEAISDLQKQLFADRRYSLLLVFQAMDAAGKDSTIRAVLTGVNPAGCEVHAFKRPTEEELDHDFLWRTSERLPRRGSIGVFNRSYYEEVLAVRVSPQFLDAQRLPQRPALDELFEQRYASIRDHERHLARNGTVIIKFWLNVSAEEQRQRLLSRLDEPEKNWKFESADLLVREHWKDYQQAYEHALNQTSRPWAPWYAIPADSKSYMRMAVADIVRRTLERMDLRWPELAAEEKEQLGEMRRRLQA